MYKREKAEQFLLFLVMFYREGVIDLTELKGGCVLLILL